jgi:hypothetical protein
MFNAILTKINSLKIINVFQQPLNQLMNKHPINYIKKNSIA